jgi:Bacterial pre-peptidase C-terminal domain.
MRLRKLLCSLTISGFFLAVQAGDLAPNASSSGSLSASHTEDWWTITTTADGSLTVNISTANASLLEQDANLYDVDGTTLLVHDGENGTTSTLSFPNLLPGTYQVKVYLYSGVGASYSISNTFTAQPIGNNTEPNDSLAQAVTMAINTSTPGHLGYYGNSFTDAADWFKITTPSDGILSISAYSDTTLEADLNIYDIDGTTQLQHDGQSTRSSLVSVPNLKPGTYFFKYYKYIGYGGYNLTTTFTPQAKTNDPEPNDTFTQAVTLGANASTTGHLGYFTNQITDTKDWYKIQLPSDGSLRVLIKSDTTLDIDANLYDIDGASQIFHDGRAGDSTILATPNLMAGTYYAKPYAYTGYGGYTITSVFIPQPLANDAEPDDSASQAIALTMNQTSQGHLGYFSNGNTDVYDWFSIVQPSSGTLWVSVHTDSTLDADCATCIMRAIFLRSPTTARPGSIPMLAGQTCPRVRTLSV